MIVVEGYHKLSHGMRVDAVEATATTATATGNQED